MALSRVASKDASTEGICFGLQSQNPKIECASEILQSFFSLYSLESYS